MFFYLEAPIMFLFFAVGLWAFRTSRRRTALQIIAGLAMVASAFNLFVIGLRYAIVYAMAGAYGGL